MVRLLEEHVGRAAHHGGQVVVHHAKPGDEPLRSSSIQVNALVDESVDGHADFPCIIRCTIAMR